jgi:hypothetical protein
MHRYQNPPVLPAGVQVDPDSGFLCLEMHWRPNPADPDPEVPGQKLSMSSFIPAQPRDPCLCGSGKSYGACCRRRPAWWPICPNPGLEGYSLVQPRAATFRGFDRAALRERLSADCRLHSVSDDPGEGFWVLWGDPPTEDDYGILCFGDIQLHADGRLEVTAMSKLRMRVLLDLLQEIAGDLLGPPEMQSQPIPVIDKAAGRTGMLSPKSEGSRRQRWQGGSAGRP